MKGKLIVIEGVDCSGKQTQAKMLCDRLTKNEYKSIMLSFPMYETPTGKIIRGPYLGYNQKSFFFEDSSNVDPYVSSLYYIADRKYNIEKIISTLDNGTNVILDRYTLSNLAHQGSKIKDINTRNKFYNDIYNIEYNIMNFPKADLSFFLYMPVKNIKKLLQNRDILDDNEKNDIYLENSSNAYLELIDKYNIKQIDCIKNDELRSINDINDELYDNVIKLLLE